MPAKKVTSITTGSKSKKAAGLAQPTLSFRSRKPSYQPDKKTEKRNASIDSTTPTPTPTPSASVTEIELNPSNTNSNSNNNNGSLQGTKRKQLNVRSKEWNELMHDARVAMGGLEPIHAGPETHDNIHHILRVFDMTSKFGPCVGITRLQRWERAKKWGLNPPEKIHDILTTEQGVDDPRYRETVLYGWV